MFNPKKIKIKGLEMHRIPKLEFDEEESSLDNSTAVGEDLKKLIAENKALIDKSHREYVSKLKLVSFLI